MMKEFFIEVNFCPMIQRPLRRSVQGTVRYSPFTPDSYRDDHLQL